MGMITTTVWPLDSHTRAKHAILRRYLQAWVPILGFGGFRQFLYIDGFAGPGRYKGGELGSPVIALNAALEHQSQITAEISFEFVEDNPARAKMLEEIIESVSRPGNFRCRIHGGQRFEQAFTKIHSEWVARARGLPATFAFVDPFGWAGVPFAIIRQILSYPNCEILLTFMYEEINRFLLLPDQEDNFNSFFGTKEWRECRKIQVPAERNRFLHDLFARQLRNVARAKFVRSFLMRNDNDVVDYYLFFATNNIRGLAKMKEAMWKVDQSGEFQFSDATDPNQLVLFDKAPDFAALKSRLVARFAGHSPTVADIEAFILSGTPFRETHYKQQILNLIP